MKVLLLDNVKKIGQRGEIVTVADGYATGYLIPRKLAKIASDREQQIVSREQEKKQQLHEKQDKSDLELFNRLNGSVIEIAAPANAQHHLFAALKPTDITSQLPGLKPEYLDIKQGIKELGEYEVNLKIGQNKGKVTIKVDSK